MGSLAFQILSISIIQAKSYLENKWDSLKKAITCGYWKKSEDPPNSTGNDNPSGVGGGERVPDDVNRITAPGIARDPDTQSIRHLMTEREQNKRQSKQKDDGNTEADSIEMQQLQSQVTNPNKKDENGEDDPTTSSSGSTRRAQVFFNIINYKS